MDWMDDAEKVLERMKSIKRRQLELYEIYEKELHEIPSIHSRAKSDSNISDAVSDNSSSTLAKPAIARGTTTTSVALIKIRREITLFLVFGSYCGQSAREHHKFEN